jgi:hypothetical protein
MAVAVARVTSRTRIEPVGMPAFDFGYPRRAPEPTRDAARRQPVET